MNAPGLAALATAVSALVGGTTPAHAQVPPALARDSLTALLPRLSPAARPDAERYLAAPDTAERRTSLRPLTQRGTGGSILSRDSLALRFYRIAGASDPSPGFRLTAISDLARAGDLPLALRRECLAGVLRGDPDSAVVFRAVNLLQELARDTTAAAALRDRMQVGPPALALGWVGRAHQRARDRLRGLALPLFMRDPAALPAAAPPGTDRIRLFAFGDWADNDTEAQRAVSRAVRAAHARTPFLFGLTLGDNFYEDGLESPRSARWQLEYERQYGILGIPIYAVLGNHDYHGSDSPAAEIQYTFHSGTWKLPATHYTFVAGPAQFFVVDTESLTPWQLGWLDRALGASRARWKIVAGHYDLYSNRSDGSSGAATRLVPLLRRHGVAVYLNGHYHTLQHYQVDGIDYVTSGAGGRKSLYDIDTTKAEPSRRFTARRHGFAVLDVTRAAVALEFRDTTGAVIYRHERRE